MNVTHATNVLLTKCIVLGAKNGHFYNFALLPKNKCSATELMEIQNDCLRNSYSKLNISVSVNGVKSNALADTGLTLAYELAVEIRVQVYGNMRLAVLKYLLTDVILGH